MKMSWFEKMNKLISKLVIQGELTDLNTYINAERSNKFMASKIKKQETARVSAVCKQAMASGVVIDPEYYPLDFEFHWYTKNKRKDKDNIVFARKFIFDGMVASGFLPNDGWRELGDFADKVRVDKYNPRVEITITRFEE